MISSIETFCVFQPVLCQRDRWQGIYIMINKLFDLFLLIRAIDRGDTKRTVIYGRTLTGVLGFCRWGVCLVSSKFFATC